MNTDVTVLTSVEQVHAFFAGSGLRIFAMFYDQDGDELEQFQEAYLRALRWEDTHFAMVTDPDLCKALRADGTYVRRLNNLIAQRPDGERDVLELAAEQTNILRWIRQHSLALVDEFNQRTDPLYTDLRLP
jgi:hypothetical protein